MQAPRIHRPSIWDMSKTSWAGVGAAVLFVIVAMREWSYRSGHPHALGPSGELIALAVAGALVSAAAVASTIVSEAARDRAERERVPDLRERMGDLNEAIALLADELGDHQLMLQHLFDPAEWEDWQEIVHPVDEEEEEAESLE